MKIIAQKDHVIEDLKIYVVLIELRKSYILLISDQKEMGLGSITIASPPTIEGMKSTSLSHDLFGIKNKILNKIIAERSSFKLKLPVLVLIFIKSKIEEEKIVRPLLEILNNIFSEIKTNS